MSISLASVQRGMSLYGLSTFYILGTIGNFLLIRILVQRSHRQNSCSLYLLSATVVNFILIQCILPVAIYSANHVDPQTTSLVWCKIRSYLFNALLMIYRWSKMAACVDRAAMCSRHAWIRNFSEARVARRVILIFTIVWLLVPIHLAVYYRIEGGRCVPESGVYAKFFSGYSILISGWSPPIIMAVFGWIAYRNLKQIRSRVNPGETNENTVRIVQGRTNHRRIGRREQQLMTLLWCEVIVYICTNLLFSINITYSAITADEVKTLQRMQIEGFIAYLSTPFLIIINNCVPFYLYLMVSEKFRQDVKKLFTFYRRLGETGTSEENNRGKTSGNVVPIQTVFSIRVSTRGH